MDPVSVIGIAASVVRTIASTIQNLHQLQQSYSGATNTLRNIIRECEVLQLAVAQVQSWTEGLEAGGSGASTNHNLQGLSHSLQGFIPSLQSLDNEVTRMLGRVGPGESMGFMSSVSFTWNEDSMRSHLADIRWHANALHFLLTATSLNSQTPQSQPGSRNSTNLSGGSPTSNLSPTNSISDTSNNPAPPSYSDGPTTNISPNTQSNKAFEVSLSSFEANLLTAEEIQMLFDISSGLRPLHQRVGADRLTAIHIAAKAGSVPTIQSILKQPRFQGRLIPTTRLSDTDNLDQAGRSAFHYAAQSGNPDALKALLPVAVKSAQAVAELGDSEGLTLFHIAARYGRTSIVEALVALFGPLTSKKLALTSKSRGYTPFLEAVSSGHENMCRLLLHHGSKPAARTKDNGTALHVAATAGQENVVPLLISCNVFLDWIDQNGESAIRIAAARGLLSTVKALIDAGAKRNRKNHQGKTALHLAAENGHAAVVEALLISGAKKEITTRNGETTVEFACGSSGSNKEVVRLLGITSQQEGASCLFRAIRSGNHDIAAYLLSTTYVDAGARDPQDKKHLPTALHVACQIGDLRIAELLLRYGASVYTRESGGNTPLHWAISSRRWEVAKCLLKAGADPDTLNDQGNSPRKLAGMMEVNEVESVMLIDLFSPDIFR
ncbi:hypothetical protein TWF694_005052 [Orbilia ellipsospora]|uniref:Ankyrin repeat protein n=1 Tax=Orbilia ellipsospora TaxID=2528407 RepID=A0AAV9WWZ4_9PEZI